MNSILSVASQVGGYTQEEITMDKKAPTKRQHYVPRMILRNFSHDKRRVDLITFADGEKRTGAISSQCQEDYFYDEDNVLENSFSAEEGKTSVLLGDLSREHLSQLSNQDLQNLRTFVGYQKARTAGEVEHMNQQATAVTKNVMHTSIKLNKETAYDERDIDDLRLSFGRAGAQSVLNHAKMTPILLDLDLKFITTDRRVGFAMADNPVVAYNQFAEHHPILGLYPGITALALKGLQLFMPVSPSVTLALFDPNVYQYGGKGLFCTAGPLDVLAMNKMQAINAMSCMYFKVDRIDEPALEAAKKARKWHRSAYDKIVNEVAVDCSGETMKQVVVLTGVDIKIGAKLSFVKVTDGHPYDTYQGESIPFRSPRLIELAKAFKEHIERLQEEMLKRDAKTGK